MVRPGFAAPFSSEQRPSMERTKKPCLGVVALLLFLLLASAAHGAQPADAKDIAGMQFCSSSGLIKSMHELYLVCLPCIL